jgi:hypothetical protein
VRLTTTMSVKQTLAFAVTQLGSQFKHKK